jgi:hypothetical protein
VASGGVRQPLTCGVPHGFLVGHVDHDHRHHARCASDNVSQSCTISWAVQIVSKTMDGPGLNADDRYEGTFTTSKKFN